MQGVLGDLLLPPQSTVTHKMCPHLIFSFCGVWGPLVPCVHVMGSRGRRNGASSALQVLIEPRDEWVGGRGGYWH